MARPRLHPYIGWVPKLLSAALKLVRRGVAPLFRRNAFSLDSRKPWMTNRKVNGKGSRDGLDLTGRERFR